MTETEFEKIVKDTLDSIKTTLVVKGKEYRRNNNPFHNFQAGALRTGLMPEKILDGFMLKHEISIDDIVNDISQGIIPSKEIIEEKFGDILIYTILKKALILDRINNKK
jgi:hypothetical protein